MSNFTDPQTWMLFAPKALSRSASSWLCASTAVKEANAGPISEATNLACPALFSDSRALASTTGMRRLTASCIMLGQTSVSITTPITGFVSSKNLAMRRGLS